MARAKTKAELIQSSQEEFQRLLDLVAGITAEGIAQPGACENWSVKDILAHLHAWHMLFLTWYEGGMSGANTPKPAPGYTWKQTPELNEAIYQEYKQESLDAILPSLKETHQEVFKIIQKHSDQELFTKKRYQWTGATSMGSYLVSATASHYQWANELIRKWLKKNPNYDHRK